MGLVQYVVQDEMPDPNNDSQHYHKAENRKYDRLSYIYRRIFVFPSDRPSLLAPRGFMDIGIVFFMSFFHFG